MSQSISILQAIADFILGKKYYANIINTRGTDRLELSCFIFRSRQEAEVHKKSLDSTLSFSWIETVSFRSRKDY